MENQISFYSDLPRSCRQCEQTFALDDPEYNRGVFWIPSLDQWLTKSSFKSERRNIDPKITLFLCNACFIEKALHKMSRSVCACCGVYDNYRGSPPKMDRSRFTIQGNLGIGDFKIVGPLPWHFEQNDNLCIACLNTLIEKGVIKRIKGSSTEKSKRKLPNSIIDHEEFEVYLVCDICNSKSHEEGKLNWGTFIDNSRFVTRSHHFVTKTPIDLAYSGATVCPDCLSRIPHSIEMNVECGRCKQKFEELIPNSNLGDGCAGFIDEKGIYCGYGSNKDFNKYIWVDNVMPKDLKHVHNICDQCIDSLILQNILLFEKEYDFWTGE